MSALIVPMVWANNRRLSRLFILPPCNLPMICSVSRVRAYARDYLRLRRVIVSIVIVRYYMESVNRLIMARLSVLWKGVKSSSSLNVPSKRSGCYGLASYEHLDSDLPNILCILHSFMLLHSSCSRVKRRLLFACCLRHAPLCPFSLFVYAVLRHDEPDLRHFAVRIIRSYSLVCVNDYTLNGFNLANSDNYVRFWFCEASPILISQTFSASKAESFSTGSKDTHLMDAWVS